MTLPASSPLSRPVSPHSGRVRHQRRPWFKWLLWLALPLALLAALLLGAGPSFPQPPPPSPPGSSSASGPLPNETYLWRPVAIGGGGYITGIDIDRSGRTKVVRTDVYGAYRWDDKADRWLQLVTTASMPANVRPSNGLQAGAYEIVVAPGDSERLYMAFESHVYRSDDAGAHWREPYAGPPFPIAFDPNSEFRLYGPFMAVSPVDHDLVFLGTPEIGLWRSADGGLSWRQITSVPLAGDLRPEKGIQTPGIATWFDPGNPDRVIAASAKNGTFVSLDKGLTFAPLAPGGLPGPRTITRGGFDGAGNFWASEEETKHAWVLRRDGWVDLTAAGTLPEKMWRGVGASPASKIVLMADGGGNLWCTANAGESWWKPIRSTSVSPRDPPWLRVSNISWFDSTELRFDPSRKGSLWVASGIAPFETDIGESCPYTLTWRSRARGIEEIVASDVVQPPGHAPLFAGWDFGVHIKPDLNAFSTTYGPKPRIIIAAQQVDWSGYNPAFLVTNASDTRNCCAEDGEAVLAGYSEDGGQSWTRFPTLPTPPGTREDDPWRMAYGSIAVSADSTDNIVWVPGKNRAPFYTIDRGKSWYQVHFPGEVGPDTGSYGPMPGGRKSLAADRVAGGTFYLVHNGGGANGPLTGFWRTRDRGVSWQKVFEGEIAPNSAGFSKLRAVPGHEGHLFFTAGVDYGTDQRLRRTRDGGVHWEAIDGVEGIDDIGFGKAAKPGGYPTIFVTGRVGGRYGAWRSLDDGRSWQMLIDYPLGWLTTVAAVEGDKDVFGRLYIGFVGGGWLYGEPSPCKPAPLQPGADRHCAAISNAK